MFNLEQVFLKSSQKSKELLFRQQNARNDAVTNYFS
jgi:hypothetical protein